MKTSRLAAVGAVVGMTVALGACAQDPGTDLGAGATTSAPPGEAQATGTPAPGGAGVTEVGDIYGPGCDQVPL
ncbi:MAG: hypothetical protein ACRDS9_03325, partial [Pseudonocardiaceae bacterium]